jgi:hypothetical protein
MPSWALCPVKLGKRGPIQGPQIASAAKLHDDFKDLPKIMDLISAHNGDPFYEKLDEEFLNENYNEPMEGKRLMYAKILLTMIVDFLYKYVWSKGGGVLKTSTLYVPQSTHVTVRSSFLEEWLPVIEEDEEYGSLTHGNCTAFILALARVATSDDPRKALGLKELP